jgi:putative PEP-CTERM system TPR-repeat lipoprotein
MLIPNARLAAVAALFFLGACGSLTDAEHVQKARAYQEQGKTDAAVIELKNALQKNGKNAEARRTLGEVYITLGLGADAEKELKRALELGVEREALNVAMGEALLLQGQNKRVLDEIDIAEKATSQDIAKILEIRGRAQFGLRRIDEACALFSKAREEDSKLVRAYWGLAHCAAARRKLDEARTELQNALKIDERNSGTWSLLGDLERTARRLPEAESAYTTALSHKAHDVNALLGRAVVRLDNNKIDEAGRDVDTAAKIDKRQPLVAQLRGILQYKQGKFADAKTSFETVLKAQPNYLPGILWMGLTNFAMRNYAQAARHFNQYVRSVPNARVQALLAVSQARMGRGGDAAETLKVFQNVNLNDPQSLAVVAQAHMSLGQADIATTYISRAVQRQPDAAGLRLGLAASLSRSGARDEAIEQLEEATQLDPSLVTADVMLIQNLLREEQYDKALEAAAALEKKQPQNPLTFNLKGAVYVKKNDLANARKAFEQALAVDQKSVSAAMNLAQLDLLENKPDAARQRFQTVLAANKNEARAMLGLAAVASATGNDPDYVAWLQKAAQAAPGGARPRLLLASHHLSKNDARKALAPAREAQRLEPHNPWALDLLGSAQLAVGERDNALATFRQLARLAPKNPVVHYKMATAHAARQDAAATRDAVSKALALKPDYLDAEVLLASAELGAGRNAEALKVAQGIQKRHRDATAGYVLEGDALLAQKKFGPAAKSYERAFAIYESGAVAVRLHQATSAGGKVREADARLAQWLEAHPKESGGRIYLAQSYVRGKQHKQAIALYEQVLQSNASHLIALNDLAWLYYQEKDARALATAERAYKARPDSPQIMDTLGWILVEQGDAARGLPLLQKASDMMPASTEMQYHVAVALAKSGDRVHARRKLENLLAKNPAFRERSEAEALLKQLR